MAKNPKEEIVSAVGEVVADYAPIIAGTAIMRLADKQPEDSVLRSLLIMMAGTAHNQGGDAITMLTDNVLALVKGDDPLAAAKLRAQGMSAQHLSLMAIELQTMEAKQRRQIDGFMTSLSVIVAQMGEVIARAAVASLVKL